MRLHRTVSTPTTPLTRDIHAIQSQLDSAITSAMAAVYSNGLSLVQNQTSAAESIPILIDFSESHGSWVYDRLSSQHFLDFHTGFGSDPFGRNSLIFQSKLAQQLLQSGAINKTAHSDFSTTQYVASVSLIWQHYIQKLGPTFSNAHVHFIDGGSMAMNQAISAAIGTKVEQNKARGIGTTIPFIRRTESLLSRKVGPQPVGQLVVSFSQSFHGRDGFTASLSHGAYKLDSLPKFGFPSIPLPAEFEASDIAHSLEVLEQYATDFGPELAAVVIEDAIQCEGGDRHLPVALYEGIRKIADRFGFFVIYDGVQTGFYSSGDPAAFLTIGAPPPDIYVTAKKASVGCVIANNKMVEIPNNAFKTPGKLDSTFGGNSTCIARFAIAATAVTIPEFTRSMKENARLFAAGLANLQKEFPNWIKTTRALGNLLTIETTDQTTAEKVIQAAFRHQLILLQSRNPSIVRIRPNLDVTATEIECGLQKLRQTFMSLSRPESPVTGSDSTDGDHSND